jgi:hypothetical protein
MSIPQISATVSKEDIDSIMQSLTSISGKLPLKELYKKLGVNKASCAVAKSMSEAGSFVDEHGTTGSKKTP